MKRKLTFTLMAISLLSTCFTACSTGNSTSIRTENTILNTDNNVVVETGELNTDADTDNADTDKEVITETSEFYSLDDLFLNKDKAPVSSYREKEQLEVYVKDAENRAKGVISGDDPSPDDMVFHFEQDGNFIWAMYGTDAGMSKTYYLTLRSKDGGDTWEIKSTEDPYTCGIDSVKVAGSCVAVTYGGGMFWSPVMISADYGDTFLSIHTQSYIPDYYSYVSDYAHAEIASISPNNNSIKVDWYHPGRAKKQIAGAEMSLDLENVRFSLADSDFSDLLEFYQDYSETGFYFANSAEDYLDEDRVYRIFNQMYLCDSDINSDKVLETIRCAINEIYARKGCDFTETNYGEYFNNRDWYNPIANKKAAEEELNSYEKANMDLLVEEENKYKEHKEYNEE